MFSLLITYVTTLRLLIEGPSKDDVYKFLFSRLHDASEALYKATIKDKVLY